MEAFLTALLPRLLPQGRSFAIHAFQGKSDLLGKLEARLRGYSVWLPKDWRIVVVVDRDDDDCKKLKQRLETVAKRAGLRSRSRVSAGTGWQVVNRIAIEELEAWYFGDWQAVQAAYPLVSPSIPQRQGYRDPDGVAGGTWEAFERVMQNHGYFKGGLPKIEVARALGTRVDPKSSRSHSFLALSSALDEAVS